ncbi:MAG: A/G-specific adenine glycosylase [Tepidiformaceae bacterium]
MRWYREFGRHTLPWRLTRDPYAVLVSEVMLQQTQVDRVLPYYTSWLTRWPTAKSLAAASVGDAIRAWGGLGYNRRAVNLHRASQAVADRPFPKNLTALRRLPGVGPYTASAIVSFAFGQRVPVVDTNIARVLARVVHGAASARDVSVSTLAASGEALLPLRSGRAHNLALMDLGALICSARRPACAVCPVRRVCAWRAAGYPPRAKLLRPGPRFEVTARFARGKIVDALRVERSLSVDALGERLPAKHRPKVDLYLQALLREGIIDRTEGGEWRLPVLTGG